MSDTSVFLDWKKKKKSLQNVPFDLLFILSPNNEKLQEILIDLSIRNEVWKRLPAYINIIYDKHTGDFAGIFFLVYRSGRVFVSKERKGKEKKKEKEKDERTNERVSSYCACA